MDRQALLNQMAQTLVAAASQGAFGDPIPIPRAETVNGPRAGAVRLFAGWHTGPLLRILAADDCALARQFIPWDFQDAQVYLDGRAVRVEAPWPPELATQAVRLREINRQPRGGGRWTIGIDELGRTVIGALNHATPHWLLAGTTGSGKTTALLGAALQFSRDPQTRLVLIDGKGGAGLYPLRNLPGLVGPIATDLESARNALGWVHRELQRRYEMMASGRAVAFPRLVVVYDEFQEHTSDPLIAELLRRIVLKGRAAQVHCLLATQHPTVRMFGEEGGAVKRNLPGRLALRVLDAKASEVVVGGPVPRADRLTGAGDAYAIATQTVRVQVALVEGEDLDEVERSEPEMDDYPPMGPEDVGQEVEEPRWSYTGEELAVALAAVVRGWGRPRLQAALEQRGLGRPGSVRADRLLRLAREQLEALREEGLEVVALQEEE
ncbi:MAG: hypothetical protein H5T61_15930 [Thermoflexales bacterium]|nr:hypothetical protein [Thermoflexales bacterium]